MAEQLTLDDLREAVSGRAAAFRCRRKLQPGGGPGTKIFPPTYAGATYAVELRRQPDPSNPDGELRSVPCVVIDSVQSQANRAEEALQRAIDDGRITLPVVEVEFPPPGEGDDAPRYPVGRITSLEAPHRLADAILRDSEYEGVAFRQSEVGRLIDTASNQNATPLYELGPHTLVFGMWDSTGPRGGLGAKFERAFVSEIVGINCPYSFNVSDNDQTKNNGLSRDMAVALKLLGDADAHLPRRLGLRRDPLNISKNIGPVYMTPTGLMTLDPKKAEDERKAGKPTGKKKLWGKTKGQVSFVAPPKSSNFSIPNAGKPSAANHGNIPYGAQNDQSPGSNNDHNAGITVDYCEQTTTLSLIALRRLRFPDNSGTRDRERDVAAHTVLAAIGLCAAALAADEGLDLRSRCLLWPEAPMVWDLLARPGEEPVRYELGAEAAVKLLNDAVAAAKKAGVKWREEPVKLAPSAELVKLVARSQAFESQETETGE